ncbi:hypothetical protein FA95DRAFT_1560436 [Auriscalpium vulgare]|uniref:Uncharacterized protein n=1 Tax=Auriscalpium vulgare TaxID=40419 RepID=A0ACB8RPS9_9AGAM|nr:hypothetical protein FA95DRAFT_1560436 [Auriscalpium vulgare]
MKAHFSSEPPVYAKPKHAQAQSRPPEARPASASATPPGATPDRPVLPPKPSTSSSTALVPLVSPPPPPLHTNGPSPAPAQFQHPPVPPKPPLPPPGFLPISGPSPPAHSPALALVHSRSTSVNIFPVQSPPSVVQAQSASPSHRWSLPPNAPPAPAQIPHSPPRHAPPTAVTASPGPVSPPPPPPFSAYGSAAAQPRPPVAPPVAAPPAPPPRNLLDEEAADEPPARAGMIASAPAHAPPRPPNPELLSLHARVHAKLTSELASLSQAMALDGERLRAHQTDLLAGEPAIRDESARLEAVRDVCRGVAGRVRGAVDAAERNVADLRRKGDPPVDELVCSTSIVHNQLIDLIAEDNAIEDTVYHLHRALNAGRIDLDRFLRTTRVLAEEQFMKRALVEKIQVSIPMGVSLASGWS